MLQSLPERTEGTTGLCPRVACPEPAEGLRDEVLTLPSPFTLPLTAYRLPLTAYRLPLTSHLDDADPLHADLVPTSIIHQRNSPIRLTGCPSTVTSTAFSGDTVLVLHLDHVEAPSMAILDGELLSSSWGCIRAR